MFPVRNFVVYSTFLGLFSSNLFFNVGSIHLLAFYFLVFLNLVFLWLSRSLWVPRGLPLFLSFLIISGAVGIARGTDSPLGFSKAFLGILPSVIYFCAFLRYMDFDVERCFRLYAQLAYYVALFGILYFPFQPISTAGRLTSVIAEPGEFCLICIPALYFYADQWQRKGQGGGRFLAILIAFILTFSSMGYMGILVGLYLYGTRYRLGKIFVPVVVVLAGVGIYSASNFFRMRLGDSVQSLMTADLTGINNSSFGLVSNVFVTEQVFLEHPLLGGGLGSHVIAHDRLAGQLAGVEMFVAQGVGDLGRWDAESLLLRIISETGLMGLALALWFLWHCWPSRASQTRRSIAMAILTYVFLKFLRSGIYFNPEEFFFFLLYALAGSKPPPAPRPLSSRQTPTNQLDFQPTLS